MAFPRDTRIQRPVNIFERDNAKIVHLLPEPSGPAARRAPGA